MIVKTPEILLVEDDPQEVELALFVLDKCPGIKNIQVVRDGEEALDFVFCAGKYAHRTFENPPRVVFLDLKLPKVDGVQVLRQIKADPRTRNIPVVALTSSNEQRDLSECYRLGLNSYVQKPVNFEEYQKMVKSLSSYWLDVNEVSSAPPPA